MKIGRKEVAYLLTRLKAIMNERVACKTLQAKKQTYEKTTNGPMQTLFALIDYEKALDGP